MGAKLARAGKIIAVDIAQNKLDWAQQFGATDLVDASKTDPVEAIKELTGGNGVDYSFASADFTDVRFEGGGGDDAITLDGALSSINLTTNDIESITNLREMAYQLDQQYGLQFTGTYGENWGGAGGEC